MEKKTLAGRLEIKLATNGVDTGAMSGYGAVFNNQDYNGDIIVPGAFTKTLATHAAAGTMPLMLLNHNIQSLPIGIWDQMSQDAIGLKMSGYFIGNSEGSDAYVTAKAGAITGLSIGFFVTAFEMVNIGGKSVRKITEANLLEVSLVTLPANDLARITDIKNQEQEMTDEETKSLMELIAEMKADMSALRGAFDAKLTKKSNDDGDDDCDCEDDDDCDCEDGDNEELSANVNDAEVKSQAKYTTAFIEAVNNLTAKLAKENHGR